MTPKKRTVPQHHFTAKRHKSSQTQLPPPRATASKLHTPAIMARAAANTKKIDEMFSSQSQTARLGNSAEEPVDLTFNGGSSQSTGPPNSSPTPVSRARRPQSTRATERKRPSFAWRSQMRRSTQARSIPNPSEPRFIHASARAPQFQPTNQPIHNQPVGHPTPQVQDNCRCGRIFDDPRGIIRCVSPDCKTKTWHKGCGGDSTKGIKKHHNPRHWLCPDCRLIREASMNSGPLHSSPFTSPQISTPVISVLDAPEPPLHAEQSWISERISRSMIVMRPKGRRTHLHAPEIQKWHTTVTARERPAFQAKSENVRCSRVTPNQAARQRGGQ